MTLLSPTLSPSRSRSERQSPIAVVVATATRFWRLNRNRRAITQLAAMDRTALADLGLTHSDVALALALPLSRDPSAYLAEQLHERRCTQQVARLCR